MRSAPLVCCFALAIAAAAPSVVQAETDSIDAARAAARHELELAKLDARYHAQVEVPRKRHELTAAIRLTELEIKRHKALLREYRPLNRFSVGNPLSLTIKEIEFDLLDARLRLTAVRNERNYLHRFRGDEARLYNQKVVDARRRVIALEGGGVIEISEPE